MGAISNAVDSVEGATEEIDELNRHIDTFYKSSLWTGYLNKGTYPNLPFRFWASLVSSMLLVFVIIFLIIKFYGKNS